MHVLVAGGTGFIGRHLCEHLVEDGHSVTALARTPDDADLPDGVDRAAGDVTDYESVADTVADHEAVVNLVALSPLYQQPAGAHRSVHFGGTTTLLRAAAESDTERFVQVSAIDADPAGPTAYLRAKGRAEEAVRSSDLEWTIVRPSIVFGPGDEIQSFTRQVTTPFVTALPGGGRTPFQPIWVGDFATALATAVTADGHAGETYEVGGPAVLTLADVTRLVHDRRVRIVPVPMPLVRVGFAILDPLPLVPFGRDQARGLTVENVVEDNDVISLGIASDELLSLAEYLDQHV